MGKENGGCPEWDNRGDIAEEGAPERRAGMGAEVQARALAWAKAPGWPELRA